MENAPPPRLTFPLVAAGLFCVIIGLAGAAVSATELSGLLADRDTVVLRARDTQLSLHDSKLLLDPLSRLPRAAVERLALQLGTDYYEQRGVLIPLSLLNLILCWLLLAGAYGSLRRRSFALPLWRFACLVNIPYAMLAMVVNFVLTHELMADLGDPTAQALAAVSKRPAAVELQELWLMVRLQLMGRSLLHGLLALCFGTCALYLHHRLSRQGERGGGGVSSP